MPQPVALIVEDETEIAELVHFHLEREGISAHAVKSGRKALDVVRSTKPDIILLDLMLPDLDGLEVCRRLKQDRETRDVPVVMLTARGAESDIVAGIEMGADDYVTKPFSPRVLLARVRAVLRRNQAPGTDDNPDRRALLDGRLVIDAARHAILVDGSPADFTVTEFALLEFLAQKPGFVRTRDQIIAAVHGRSTVLSPRTVDVHVTAVRRKLGPLGDAIETVRGVGYRFSEEAPTSAAPPTA